MDSLAPELVAFIAFLGVLLPADILEWACASKSLHSMLLGSEWHVAHVQAMKGLDWCCEHGTAQSVRYCLEQPNCDPTARSSFCLRIAAMHSSEAVRVLLEDGRADPAAHDSACLRLASQFNPEAVRYLLTDKRAKPDAWQSECLWAAVRLHPGIVQLILDDGRVDPASRNHYVYSANVIWCTPETKQMLLEDGRAEPSLLCVMRNDLQFAAGS